MAYVLVVDDAPDSVDPVCTLLRRAGHETACVENGRAALSAILRRAPDVILLDLYMPGMDGAALVEVLRYYRRLARLPVVVYTAAPDSPLAERVRDMGVACMLAKAQATGQQVVARWKPNFPLPPTEAAGPLISQPPCQGTMRHPPELSRYSLELSRHPRELSPHPPELLRHSLELSPRI